MMPAKTETQRNFMKMVRAYQKGELDTSKLNPDTVKKIKKAAKGMTKKEVKKFTERAESVAQQRLMGAVYQYEKTGTLPKKKRFAKKIKDIANGKPKKKGKGKTKGISKKSAKKYASTKTTGLPYKVTENYPPTFIEFIAT